MPLHPQVQKLVDELNALEEESVWDRPIADVRAEFDELANLFAAPGPAVSRVENREIPGPHGPIPLRIYWPEASDPAKLLPVFINFHG
ncbi:MAG: hypothetical protein CFH38_00226, partial [Alphaproteobacteria bacterium MarineAlpha10_Bin1]